MIPHPNAIIGGLGAGSGLGSLLAWGLNTKLGAGIPGEGIAAIAGGVAATVMFIGRDGFSGLWSLLKNGSGGHDNLEETGV